MGDKMKHKKLNTHYAVRVERGEDVIEALTKFAEEKKIKNASISGIGAADKIEVGLYNVDERAYHSEIFEGEMEVTSFMGNITEMNGKPYLHLHITFSDETMKNFGGHLNYCRISGTGEIYLTCYEETIDRFYDDEETGLNLMALDD